MNMNTTPASTKPPFRKMDWLPRDIAVERRPDGVIVLKSRFALQPYERHLPALLAKWAAERPDRIWLASAPAPSASGAGCRTARPSTRSTP